MMRCRSLRRAAGFTLIELLVVVALVAAVLTLAAPSFTSLIKMQRLRSTNAQLVSDIQFARTEAVSRQRAVFLKFNPNAVGMSCYMVHVCPTFPAAQCACDCSVAAGTGCRVPEIEIRTVQVPQNLGVRVAPVAGPDGTVPDRLFFDPVTGGMTGQRVVPLMGVQSSNSDVWLESSFTGGGAQPALRTMIGLSGRPSICAPAGRVSGVTVCP